MTRDRCADAVADRRGANRRDHRRAAANDTAGNRASLQLAADRRRRPLHRGARERLHAGHARGHRRAGRLHGDRPCRQAAVRGWRRCATARRRTARISTTPTKAGRCMPAPSSCPPFSRRPSSIGLSGGDVGLGIAVGCEVMCRLCLVAPKRVHQAGFHPTAVFGAIAAAAGVGAALATRCDDNSSNAMGIAGSMASGIIEYLAEGAWTKRMHPGWAAQSGYRAARLAQAGFVGPRTVFEGEHGFFHAFAQSARRATSTPCSTASARSGSAPTSPSSRMPAARWRIRTSTARASWSPPASIPPTSTRIECDTAEGIVHRLWEPLAAKQQPAERLRRQVQHSLRDRRRHAARQRGLARIRRVGGARSAGAGAGGQGRLSHRSRTIRTRAGSPGTCA